MMRKGVLGVGALVLVGFSLILIVDLASGCKGTGDRPCMELVAHVGYPMGGDIQFQRRSGAHTLDGVSVDTTTDLVFASAHTDLSRTDGGIEIIDITIASNPRRLTRIPCPGYQSDVAVYETLLLQTLDHRGSNAGCDPAWLLASGSAAVDRAGTAGVRIFDVTDPARPRLIHFLDVTGEIGDGVHDLTVLPWAGIAYLAQLNGNWGSLVSKTLASPRGDRGEFDLARDEVELPRHRTGSSPITGSLCGQ